VATSLEPIEPLQIAGIREHVREHRPRPPARSLLVVPFAAVVIAVALWSAFVDSRSPVGPGRVLCASIVVVWAVAAVLVALQRPGEPLPFVMVLGAAFGTVAVAGSTLLGRDLSSSAARDLAALARAGGLALLPACALHLTLALPDGRLLTTGRRVLVAIGYLASVAVAVALYGQRPSLPLAALAVLAAVDALVALGGFVARGQRAPLSVRARFQWPAWGATVAVAIGAAAAVLNALVDWPQPVGAIAVGATVLVPISLVLGASAGVGVRIDRLLVHTIVLAGLVGLVGASYLLIVLGLGRSPDAGERTLLGLSMLAAAVAALLWVPARERLSEWATRRVYGERHAPDEVLRTFGSRLTRALPLDELLLQLAESLKKTMALDVAEVWTRTSGRLERAVSVPDRGPAAITLGSEEETVVARAGVSGPAWARVWLPAVVPQESDPILRVAPVTNSGELLGLLVVRRPVGAVPFGDDDDQAFTELARQVGLALHNVKLDSALQESLDEVRRQADELRASRARIVEATDAERRRIERDLHDGAQQHLVALAVSVRLARQLADVNPDQAKEILDQLGTDLQDAVQELRNLAHGIYPPLLMERGLAEALSAAAGRAALPTSVEAEGIGRHPQPVEAAVYFCVLEALQNAGKHAGDGSEVTITLREEEGALLFDVADDGAGFELATGAHQGHGFVNMSDRVGAFGGSITVDSAPGKGTRISGRLPLGT
jgi:signal transduction histidine kinase